jgi:copper chaperone CopZ
MLSKLSCVLTCIFLGMSAGCGSDVSMSPAATAVAFNTAGAPTVEFSVPDMMCPEGCGEKTKEILSGLPGAKEVVINFDAKTATVAVEEGKFDSDAAIAALVDHGFDHSTLKSDQADDAAAVEPAVQPAG